MVRIFYFVILEKAIPPAAGQGARVLSLLDAGFHRHDEVPLGFTRSGQALHFCFSVYFAQIIESFT
jgi:hypothetical protein